LSRRGALVYVLALRTDFAVELLAAKFVLRGPRVDLRRVDARSKIAQQARLRRSEAK
jgi:hypothetical protein